MNNNSIEIEHKDKKEFKSIKEIFLIILTALLFSSIINLFVFERVLVVGNSMYPTYEDGEKLFLWKFTYLFGDVERGDIVVFNATEDDKYIKRVIGISGDSIEMKDDILYVNGKVIEENYLNPIYKEDTLLNNDNFDNFTSDFKLEEITDGVSEVPEGYVFVMGDNRPFSNDSRAIGFVDTKEILGEVFTEQN